MTSAVVNPTMSNQSKRAVAPTGIHSVTIEVDDLDRASTFYTEVMGCELQFDGEALPGERLVAVGLAGSATGILLIRRGGRLPIGIRYLVADADATHAALSAAGVTPHTEVLHLEGAPPMFTFSDSEDNTVIVMQGTDG